ncbi:alpha/beta fold hydrolase [Arthrobacter sp. MMS18-M83]|uniref:alpha/beta fold hydrolase n=1 Tax=Arthrobacter sp. MMS18-M83 TaxID=2996261 RepID=UPI00227C0FA2|nr:alpha/beta hydrolase [Arthrobacter sp. MMS18-M83]WAH97545.1 alpha/beta hydrolase [Arthrobacter sp. MMS18-M83]WAH97567.1 alpha/beta hydrolase [Arthrobacter sp. MMS18-M83]
MTAHEYQEGRARVNGLDIHYLEWGKRGNQPLVMVHGLNVTAHTWDPIARRLAEKYHVIAPDLRGHGESSWSPQGYAVRAFAGDVTGLLEQMGIGPYYLVGHSNGVRVSIAIAGENPGQVRRMALSDAGPATSVEGARFMRDFIQRNTNLRGFRDENEVREFYVGQHPEWVEEFIDLHVKYQVRRNWAGKLVPRADPDLQWITGSVSLPDGEYLWEMSAKAAMPTLYMIGRTSNVLDQPIIDRLQQVMPDVRVEWFETGHYIPREQPKQFTDSLLDFFAEGDQP